MGSITVTQRFIIAKIVPFKCPRWPSFRRPSIRRYVHTFKHEYLLNQLTNLDQISYVVLFGGGLTAYTFGRGLFNTVVTRRGIKSQTSSNLGQVELLALERCKFSPRLIMGGNVVPGRATLFSTEI